jgi:hypothetical protein
MKFRTAAALEAEITFIKQIEFAAKGRFGPARSLGYRADAAKFRRQPIHDETRFREWPRAKNQPMSALGRLHQRFGD